MLPLGLGLIETKNCIQQQYSKLHSINRADANSLNTPTMLSLNYIVSSISNERSDFMCQFSFGNETVAPMFSVVYQTKNTLQEQVFFYKVPKKKLCGSYDGIIYGIFKQAVKH